MLTVYRFHFYKKHKYTLRLLISVKSALNRKSNSLWYSFIDRKTIDKVLCHRRLIECRRKFEIENCNRFSIFVFGRIIDQSCALQVTIAPQGELGEGRLCLSGLGIT